MGSEAPEAHAALVREMRARREASLRDPAGWLSLVGLHWLEAGTVTIGGDPSCSVVLHAEAGEVPGLAGTIRVDDGHLTIHPVAGVTLEGQPVPDGLSLIDGEAYDGTILELASLRLQAIRRSPDRLGLRVRDTAAPLLRAFRGLDYFEIDPAWRVTGRLEPAEPGATIPVPDVLGNVVDEPTPGDLVFRAGGEPCRLHSLEEVPGHLWLIFSDGTSGIETYGGGRFLLSGPVADDGSVEIDFNLACNPPCALTPHATCPLPPPGNRLAVRVTAGERTFDGGHARPVARAPG